MTQFKELILENVRSYKNLSISFNKGSSLLSGDIGSGKTSILLGLQFALFGLQPGQKGASILRHGETIAITRLKIEIDGDLVTMERTLKKSKTGSVTQDSNLLTINGEQRELSTSEMKERVIALLNYPKELARKSNLLYKFTVYMPQEEMKAIIEESPEARLDTLRYIFGLDRYKRIKENAHFLLKKLKESIKIKEVLISETNLIKEKFAIESENKIQITKQINNIQIEFSTLKKGKQRVEETMQQLQDKLTQRSLLNSELEKLKITSQSRQDLLEKTKKEISSMQSQIKEIVDFSQDNLFSTEKLLGTHKKTLEELNANFLKLNSQVSVLKSKREQPLELKETIVSLENCPVCLQTVGQDHKIRMSKKLEYEIQDIDRELEQKRSKKNTIISEIEKEKELILSYEADRLRLQENKIKAEHQRQIKTKIQSESYVLDRILGEIENLRSKIQATENSLLSTAKLAEELDTIKQIYKAKTQEAHSKEIVLATKQKELELLKIKLKDLSSELDKKEKIKQSINKLKELNFWIQKNFIDMIDRTEKNLITQVKNEFSNALSKWFFYMISDNFTIELNEQFTPSIKNQDYEIDYAFLSGGERTSVALAYRLALNQVLGAHSHMKTNGILILDEPTDGFSSEQVQKMGKIFEELQYSQMILVSHEREMDNFVDRVIEIKKDTESKI
jgi:DNA repair protein SbcC/Rad50